MDEKVIENRKKLWEIIKEARRRSKPSKCILCGKEQTSFCNSHSIPQFVLRAIEDNGKFLWINSIIGEEAIDLEKGTNNAGTFHFICDECDRRIFRDYENVDAWDDIPSDIMMAEIALKDSLMMISKRNEEKEMFNITQEKTNRIIQKEILDDIKDTDTKEYTDEMNLYQSIIKNEGQGGFQILLYVKLPYTVPLAVQTPICMYKDTEGNIVNDVYEESHKCRMQNMHLCVFPIKGKTIILAFYHRKDKNYRPIRHQINCMTLETKLVYINYLIFAYTENFFASKSIKNIIDKNENICKLSKEVYGVPEFGVQNLEDILRGYTSVRMDEIPNFLSKEYGIENN